MKKIFIPELKDNGIIKPDVSTMHRIKDVLRAEEGSLFEFIDGEGLVVQAEYIKKDDSFLVKEVRRVEKDNKKEICLMVSIIRRERFDLLVEKAVELGADRIIPFKSERSRPYSNDSYDKLRERWQRIADQALSQCKRDFRCVIDPIITFDSLVPFVNTYGDKIGFDPTGKKMSDLGTDKNGSTVCVIGPEGGFTKDELNKMISWGVSLYSIPGNILRTETAVFYALSLINFTKFSL